MSKKLELEGIDWDAANRRLAGLKEESLSFLSQALESPRQEALIRADLAQRAVDDEAARRQRKAEAVEEIRRRRSCCRYRFLSSLIKERMHALLAGMRHKHEALREKYGESRRRYKRMLRSLRRGALDEKDFPVRRAG